MLKHIVILKKKYYDKILSGEKTIESRWSYNKCLPYLKVNVGDELLIKECGKDVEVIATVCKVEFYELNPQLVDTLRIKYGKEIGSDKIEDWLGTMNKKYCSLVWFNDVKKVSPFKVKKSNGAGWMIQDKE